MTPLQMCVCPPLLPIPVSHPCCLAPSPGKARSPTPLATATSSDTWAPQPWAEDMQGEAEAGLMWPRPAAGPSPSRAVPHVLQVPDS